MKNYIKPEFNFERFENDVITMSGLVPGGTGTNDNPVEYL